jgi:hypothetical protein
MTDSVIVEAKKRIEAYDLIGMQELFEDIKDNKEIDMATIYLKVYLHACLKKEGQIKEWLEQMFEHFDPINKIALRQVFPYGRYLYSKDKKTESR